LIIKK